MEAHVWERVNRVLDELEPLEGAELESALKQACAGDQKVEQEVRTLLNDLRECPKNFLGDALSSAAVTIAEGQTLGDFRLIRRLGTGGGGTVFEAHQISLDRRVALKVRPISQPALEPRLREPERRRMRREAVIAGRLKHPGIAAIFSFGRERNCDWIAMELVPGHDLNHEILRQSGDPRRGAGESFLPGIDELGFLESRITLVREVALALHAAHETGVIHRDVKPANIVLQRDRSPKLVDFGLARGPSSLTVTAPEIIAGSVYFMSPEQARGEALDRRTDIYSLGSVLFQLVSGRLPFPGLVLTRVLQETQGAARPRLRDVDPSLPKDLEAVCAKAMNFEASRRYVSALEFSEDLARVLAGEPARAREMTPWYRLQCWMRRHRKKLWLALGSAGALTLLVFLLVQSTERGALHREATRKLGAIQAQASMARGSGPGSTRGPAQAASQASIGALISVRQQLDRFERSENLHPDQLQEARALQAEITAIGRARSAQLVAELEAAIGEPGFVPADGRALLSALEDFNLVGQLLPLDERALPKGLSVKPCLSLRTNAGGDLVRVHPENHISGEYQALAVHELEAPLVRQPVGVGRYRIVVERPGVGFAELSRWIGEWGRSYELGQVRILPTAQVIQDMVLCEASEQEIVLPVYLPGIGFSTHSYAHADFYIDRTEVSNRDYMKFLEANPGLKVDNSFLPRFWQLGRNQKEWLDRPATGISWYAARAYAEFRGKRLPTELEWNRAALGAERRTYPWGEEAALVEQVLSSEALGTPSTRDEAELYRLYLRYVQPVDQLGIDTTPGAEAILHLAGNVSEWTDSMALGEVQGRLYPVPTHRRSKGWNWWQQKPQRLESYEEEQASAPTLEPIRGFRCAKSAASTR